MKQIPKEKDLQDGKKAKVILGRKNTETLLPKIHSIDDK